jgi:hypothetical protein
MMKKTLSAAILLTVTSLCYALQNTHGSTLGITAKTSLHTSRNGHDLFSLRVGIEKSQPIILIPHLSIYSDGNVLIN